MIPACTLPVYAPEFNCLSIDVQEQELPRSQIYLQQHQVMASASGWTCQQACQGCRRQRLVSQLLWQLALRLACRQRFTMVSEPLLLPTLEHLTCARYHAKILRWQDSGVCVAKCTESFETAPAWVGAVVVIISKCLYASCPLASDRQESVCMMQGNL